MSHISRDTNISNSEVMQIKDMPALITKGKSAWLLRGWAAAAHTHVCSALLMPALSLNMEHAFENYQYSWWRHEVRILLMTVTHSTDKDTETRYGHLQVVFRFILAKNKNRQSTKKEMLWISRWCKCWMDSRSCYLTRIRLRSCWSPEV